MRQAGEVIDAGMGLMSADGRSTSQVATNGGALDGIQATAAFALLSLSEASELTARIGRALDHAELLIAHAYLGRAWIPLGLPGWNGYVDRFFGTRPMLTVPREDRSEVVRSLNEVGMSGRAIARTIGVSEGTVRNDLSTNGDDDLGAQNCALPSPDVGEVECPTCGESHLDSVGTCPYLEEAWGTIVDQTPAGRDLDSGRVYGPGSTSGHPDAESIDEAAGETDTEADPLPEDDFTLPEAEASRRARRLRSAVERVTVFRDDLDELPALVEAMATDLVDWPAGVSVGPPADALDRLRDELEAVRRRLPDLPGWLAAADKIAAGTEPSR